MEWDDGTHQAYYIRLGSYWKSVSLHQLLMIERQLTSSKWSKIIFLLQPFSKVKKVSIHTPLEKKPLAPVNVFIPFEVGDLSPETHICKSAFLGPLSCQSPAYFEGDLPPEFLHLSRNMAPRLTSRVFLGWKNTNLDSPTPTHPLFLLLCKREWIR